ncbi:AI-2E family transporter [Ornithinimicrobium sp. Arc0846-15]|nr:AI-2E family transporter [Ornithinimicrobium laminariae]
MAERKRDFVVRSRTSPILSLAALVIVVAGVQIFSEQFGPLALGFIIVLAVTPLRTRLISAGAPAWVATLSGFLAAIGIVVGLVVSLVWCVAQMTAFVRDPQYQEALRAEQDRVAGWLSQIGVEDGAVVDAITNLDMSRVVSTVGTALSGVLGVVTAIGLVILVMFFMMTDAGPMASRVRELGKANPLVGKGLNGFVDRTRTYLIVTAAFGGIVAVLDGAFLWAMGIPLVGVWVVLSFVTNFIPNVGFIIGVIPPALVALLTQGPETMIWVIVGYSLLNFVIQSLIQPRIVGDSVGLSTTLTFVSLVFWSFVMGPLGSILAVPLTLLAKALLVDIDPNLQWLRPLISLQPDDGLEKQALVETGSRGDGAESMDHGAVAAASDRDDDPQSAESQK